MGTLILTGANAYGDTAISSGSLQIGNGGATGSLGSGNVLNNGFLTFNLSAPYTFGGTISGSGTVAPAGTGSLTFTAAQSYTGATEIQAGSVLVISGAGSLAATGTVWVNGTLDVSTAASPMGTTVKSLSAITPSSGKVLLGANTLTISNNSGTFNEDIYGGDILGTGGVTIAQGSPAFHPGFNPLYRSHSDCRRRVAEIDSNTGSIASSGIVDVEGTFDPESGTVQTLTGSGTVSNSVTLINASSNFAGILNGTATVTGGTETFSGSGTASFNINNGATVALTGGANFLIPGITVNGTFDISGANAGVSARGLDRLGRRGVGKQNAFHYGDNRVLDKFFGQHHRYGRHWSFSAVARRVS